MGLSGFVKKLKNEVNITDLISSYIPIQKSGKNYKARCPFHEERTASFYIYESTQSYHCFGCGANGDIIKFVEDYEHVDFKEAVEKIAQQYNFQIPAFDSSQDQKYLDYTKDMQFVETVFRDNLVKGTSAWVYLQNERNLNPEKLKQVGAGFATYKDIRQLSAVLDKNRLKELGIMTQNETLLFANRLILPIHNAYGRTIAFSGRRLVQEKTSPKYINSPQTDYFNKSKVLYLLDKTKSEIKEVDFAIIVEGYLDALRLYLNGIKNVVAVMGTALTKDHLRELSKYTNKIVFAFDNDKAGKSAVGKSYEQLDERFNALVLDLNPVKDPDEYIIKYGVEGFQEALLKSVPIEEYLIAEMKTHFDLDKLTGKDAFIKSCRDILARTRRAGNISRFDKLITTLSDWVGLDKKLLLETWNVEKKQYDQKKAPSVGQTKKRLVNQPLRRNKIQLKSVEPEEELMVLYLFHPATRKKIEELFDAYGLFMQKSYRVFFEDVREKFKPDDAADYLSDYFEESQINYFIRQIERYEHTDVFPGIISDCESKLKERQLKRELLVLDELIQTASPEEIKVLYKKRMKLSKEIHNLK